MMSSRASNSVSLVYTVVPSAAKRASTVSDGEVSPSLWLPVRSAMRGETAARKAALEVSSLP